MFLSGIPFTRKRLPRSLENPGACWNGSFPACRAGSPLCYTDAMRKIWKLIRPAVFWQYRRGSWQYDVIVGLILVFIFATPRAWFRDQPRIPNPQQIVMLPSENGRPVFWIDPELVADAPPEQLEAKIHALLQKRTGRQVGILKVEPARDSEGSLKGYLVRAQF